MWNESIKIYASKKENTLDEKIGKYLIGLGRDVFKTKLSDVSSAVGCSPSTITKFLHKCGFDGWKTYTTFAYISLNKNSFNIQSDLAKGKSEIFKYIEQVHGKVIDSLIKKISSSKKIILCGHQTTRDYLKLFGRNLRVIGKDIEIIDISEKYYHYDNKYNTVIIIVSFSGKNSNIKLLAERLKKNNLATKIFISPSEYFFDSFNYNLSINSKKLLFSTIERAIPLLRISYVQHIFDMMLSKIITSDPKKVMKTIENIGLSNRIKK